MIANKKAKLLIVDDDSTLLKAVELYLVRAGYDVTTANNGLEGLQRLYAEQPDVVLLDIMMPKMDGWDACRRIRELTNTPVIMLTARGQENDKVTGLKMGADDYVTKPFSLRELEARVSAVIRRAQVEPTERSRSLYANGDLVIDPEKLEVLKSGERIELTSTELRLLVILAENAGRVLTHRQLLESVWGPEYVDDVDYTKLFIWRLRQKIEANPKKPEYILTERGIGYRLARSS